MDTIRCTRARTLPLHSAIFHSRTSMSVANSAPARASFELKSATLPLIAVVLKTTDLSVLASELARRLGETPDFFEQDPVIVDLSQVQNIGDAIDFDALVRLLREHQTLPVAVRGGNPAQMDAARRVGLSEAADVPARIEMPPRIEIREVVREVALPPPPTMVLDRPLRSGQQVYAKGGDLIVLAAVSFGAEVIADGNIHVYAPLRGRAIAGARGNVEARIFTTCLEPQLISIAGIYRTSEVAMPEQLTGKPAKIRLLGEKLIMEPL